MWLALREAYAVSLGTRCRQFMFSLSLNPPSKADAPVAAFEAAIENVEATLGLNAQPRIVVFREKEGRRHAHCVWSRINVETMTAVNLAHTRLKLQDVSRQLYFEHGWKMPEGMIDREFRNPLNFDRHEWQQARRTGQDPRDIKALFRQCWAASDSGRAFLQALQLRGYYLARGDRRGVVAVDIHGEVYAVARWTGLKSKDVFARMADLGMLPSVAETTKKVHCLVRDKLTDFVGSASVAFAQAAHRLGARRVAMVERQRAERQALQSAQAERRIEEAKARVARFRKGILGLWDRITGKHEKLRRQNEEDARQAAERDDGGREGLVAGQLQE